MELQDQADALMREQGALDAERDLLESGVETHGTPLTSRGVNAIHGVVLASGTEAFHKPWNGVDAVNARAYGHDPYQIPINECAAWRLAAALGPPLVERVAPCVLWSYRSLPGSLSRRAEGIEKSSAPFRLAHDQCLQAALFDSLTAQQDRNEDNYRWDDSGQRLTLFDHGYAFAKSGDYAGKSIFVDWRWKAGAQALADWERNVLDRLTTAHDLIGMASILLQDRAEALLSRATSMLGRGQILRRGEF
jgi:hypothetical protein